MKYQVNLKDGYVMSLIPSLKNGWLEIDIEQYDFSNNRLQAYKLVDNTLVFDNNRYQEILKDIEKKQDIETMNSLQILLDDSDYVMAQTTEYLLDCTTLIQFLKVFSDIKTKYRDKIANRKIWRKQIQDIKEKWNL